MKHLKERISSQNNIMLDLAVQSDFSGMMSEVTAIAHKECPEGTFKRIFWDQQVLNDKRQI